MSTATLRGCAGSPNSIFACDSSSGLVRSERAIDLLADGRIERGQGSERLERMLNR